MSIEQNWKQFEEGQDDELSALLQTDRVRQLQSSNPLQKIKRNLFASMLWAIVIVMLYILMLIYFPYWQVIVSIGIILLYTAWGGVTSFIQFKNIQPSAASQQPLLTEMEKQYKAIQRWIRLQLRFAIFAYPAGALGGFVAGLLFSTGKGIDHVESLLSKPTTIITICVTIAILVPCGLYISRRLLDKSYGQHLVRLKNNIDALKGE